MVPLEGDRGRVRRDPYSAVGAATRAAIDRAARCPRLTVLDMRTLLAVVHLLTSWSRLEDSIGVRQVASIVYGVDRDALSGGQRERVARSLTKLGRADVLDVLPGKGHVSRALIRLPTRSRDDVLPPPSRTGQHGPATTLSVPQHGPATGSTRSRGEGNTVPPRGHSEDCSEDSSEPARDADSDRPLKARVADTITRLAGRYPTLRNDLEKHRRLRQAVTAQIDAGWPMELLVNQATQLTLDGMDHPAAALASRIEKLGPPPPSPADRHERELSAAFNHGSTVQRTGQTPETVREMARSDRHYRDDTELQRRFLIGAGLNPDDDTEDQ